MIDKKFPAKEWIRSPDSDFHESVQTFVVPSVRRPTGESFIPVKASFQGRPPCCPGLRTQGEQLVSSPQTLTSACVCHKRGRQREWKKIMEDTRGTSLTSFQLAGRNVGSGRKERSGGRGQAANGLWIYAIDISTHQLLVIALAHMLQTWLYCANNFTHAWTYLILMVLRSHFFKESLVIQLNYPLFQGKAVVFASWKRRKRQNSGFLTKLSRFLSL